MIFGELRLQCPQWNVIIIMMVKMMMIDMISSYDDENDDDEDDDEGADDDKDVHSRKVDSSRDRLPAILEPSWLV